MKISVPTRVLKEIGELDGVRKYPTVGRVKIGMKTICDRCRKPIDDEFFICGLKKGYPNMKFHEACISKR